MSAAVLLCVMLTFCGCGARQRTVIWNENLDENVLELDGEAHTLRELAFYVAYEEQLIAEQALVYDAKKPKAYWNIHMNGHFVRVRARQEAMNHAVHDLIFIGMANELGMELSEEEQVYALTKADDYWMDLGESGQQRLGVSLEEFEACVQKMALAQKYQELHAAMAGLETSDFNLGESAYDKLRESHSIKVRDQIWNGINIGHITLE